MSEGVERKQQPLPAVPKGIFQSGVRSAEDGTVAETTDGVARGVEFAELRWGVGQMEEIAIFRGEQEDEPVDEAEELREEAVAVAGGRAESKRARAKTLTEFGIVRMLEESVGEAQQCFFDVAGR